MDFLRFSDHEKQAAHGWGGITGEGELADEMAGENLAKQEEAVGGWDTELPPPLDDEGNVPDTATAEERANAGAAENEAPAEPEDKSKSYEDYLAEQMEKRAALGGPLEARKANEGGAGKFPEGKALKKNDGAADFMAAAGPKSKREREKKQKNVLDIDQAWDESQATPAFGGRGGRGRARGEGGFRGGDRGGRGEGGFRGGDRGGRGEVGFRGGDRGGRGGGFRGDRGDRGERGDRGDRGGRGRGGAFRGGRGDRGDRGGFRGDRGGERGGGARGPNLSDESAFPSLGS